MKKLLFAMTALMSSAVATAQSLNVTGSVVDETGEALAGATVLVRARPKAPPQTSMVSSHLKMWTKTTSSPSPS